MPATGIPLDVRELRRLVADGATMGTIAMHFRVSVGTVRTWLRRHGLTAKPGDAKPRVDPTPEEIQQRAAECRMRHLAAMLRETPEETAARLSRSA